MDGFYLGYPKYAWTPSRLQVSHLIPSERGGDVLQRIHDPASILARAVWIT
ncbi:MAG: hypothetical protein ACLFUV_01990 [Methanomassiliicoccales archaeon]